ncbi:glutamate--tRNA ligase [Patescibacteria group bacterium]
MSKVRVRIAPSPTGFAHIGTLWMALFNYAYAKRNHGKFILRLDDTDIDREVKGAEQAIYENLTWAGITWDEGPDKGGKFGPYKQSEKLDVYKSKAEELIRKKLAFLDEGAIRVKAQPKQIEWIDLKRGIVVFPAKELEKDFVIIKSNGYPTYHFATVVDEIDMKISHVIRGDEHISNTPRQILFYELLGYKPPEFAHIPTIRNKSGKKLSKRSDPIDLSAYRKQGYLPEALVNYLCQIGWSHPKGKDVFDLDEFVELFSLDRVQKSEPKLDTDKLDWINATYIRNISVQKFDIMISNSNSDYKKLSNDKRLQIASLVQTRIKKLSDFNILAGFFFRSPRVDIKLLGQDYKNHLNDAHNTLTGLSRWKIDNINNALADLIEKQHFTVGKFYMDVRIAITGSKMTPPINESLEILGKDETLKRLKKLT